MTFDFIFMRIAIIGGGLTGLAAAYKLSQNPHNKILVFEKEKILGGMLGSYDINNYRIEKYYHHIFLDDKIIIDLLKELSLGQKLKWNLAKNSYYINGEIYSLNTPLDFLKLPNFSLIDLAKLAFLIKKIKNIRNFESLDSVRVKEWVVKNSNKNIWDNFVSPLLQSKFGKNYRDISAAWFAKRIQIRAHRKWNGEVLGYLEGGFWQLIEKLKEKIEINGGKIYCNASIEKITAKEKIAKEILVNKKIIPVDKIIFTASANLLAKISTENINLPPIKYQGTVCVLLSLKKKLTQDTYWLNIKDACIPFRALIEHTNFISEKNYRNEHLIYLTYYFQDTNDSLAKMENSKIIDLYFDKLKILFPHFDKNIVNWWRIKKEFPTAPIYETGYLKYILPCETKIKNLCLAGINSIYNYPERSIKGSLLTGINISDIIQG